jgi:hypothetical protein
VSLDIANYLLSSCEPRGINVITYLNCHSYLDYQSDNMDEYDVEYNIAKIILQRNPCLKGAEMRWIHGCLASCITAVDIEAVRQVLAAGGSVLFVPESNDRTRQSPLCLTLRLKSHESSLELVEALLEMGANVNENFAQQRWCVTQLRPLCPLHLALSTWL